MLDLFDDEKHPEWILLVICDNQEMENEQKEALSPYHKHFADRDMIVVIVSPEDSSVEHGNRICSLTTAELIKKYALLPDRVSYVLIGKDDCLKWAAPTQCSIADVISLVDEMPLHDAENAARRPELLRQGNSPSHTTPH